MDEKPAAPPPASGLPVQSRMTLFVGVPITLIILGIAVWALLSGMPFSSDNTKLTRTGQPAPVVVNEQAGSTATTSEIGSPGEPPPQPLSAAGRGTDVISTTTTAMPEGMGVPAPQTTTQPAAAPPRPPQTSAAAAKELSESQAEDVVREYIASRDYYRVGADCVGAASQGYRNRGYTIDVVDRCGDRGRLGRWRVDSVTREVFVRNADGRYLAP